MRTLRRVHCRRIVLWRRDGNWGVGIRRVEMFELRIYHGSTDSEKKACSISACESAKRSRETDSIDSHHRCDCDIRDLAEEVSHVPQFVRAVEVLS